MTIAKTKPKSKPASKANGAKGAAAPPPFSFLDLIAKKRDGGRHSEEELRYIAQAAGTGGVPDYQLTAWLMAVVIKGMDEGETAALTVAMGDSGERLDLGKMKPVVDKHSTGGVGDGVSIALAPLVASAGVTVPMMSGRGLGHTGGTLDKLEAIAGFKVRMKPAQIVGQLHAIRVAMFGQTDELAPADRRLYALRDASATVPSVPLICGSILSKKLAENLQGLVIDVKSGSGAIFATDEEAETLAKALVATSKRVGLKSAALVTAMDEPLGLAVGNAVEVAQAVQVLHGDRRASDYFELMLTLGGWMLHLGGKARSAEEGAKILEERIAHGAALDRFREMVKRQGGDARVVDDPHAYLPRGRYAKTVQAPNDGTMHRLDARTVGESARLLGAGRERAEDATDPAAGILLTKKVGHACVKGEVLATLYASDKDRLELAHAHYLKAITIGKGAPKKKPLIGKIIR